MTLQFDKLYEVQIGEILITDLDVNFKVTRTSDKDPNTCEVTVFNLNRDNRDAIGGLENPVVQIKAGYRGRPDVDTESGQTDSEGNMGVIFLGDCREAGSTYDPPLWLTVVESGDGERSTRFDRINRSFAKGTSFKNVIDAAAKSMRVGLGNLTQGIGDASISEYVNGVTLSGQSSKQLDRLARSAGLEWSIQNSELQVLKAGATLSDFAVKLTPDTGLIGSTTIDSAGVLRGRALLNSDIIPGRQLVIESLSVSGEFKVKKTEFTGSSQGTDWDVVFEAERL